MHDDVTPAIWSGLHRSVWYVRATCLKWLSSYGPPRRGIKPPGTGSSTATTDWSGPSRGRIGSPRRTPPTWSRRRWLRLVENLGRLQDPERVGAWLATTARRECLRTLRHSARQVPTEELPEEGVDARLDAALLVEERDRALWQAFGGLSERCQALLRILVADPPPSYEDIGAALDMPIGSIGPTRQRCLERLRGLAEGEGVTATDRRELE